MDAKQIVRELIDVRNLRERIDVAERQGVINFVDGKAIPLLKDDLAKREVAAWRAAFDFVGAP